MPPQRIAVMSGGVEGGFEESDTYRENMASSWKETRCTCWVLSWQLESSTAQTHLDFQHIIHISSLFIYWTVKPQKGQSSDIYTSKQVSVAITVCPLRKTKTQTKPKCYDKNVLAIPSPATFRRASADRITIHPQNTSSAFTHVLSCG